MNYRRGKIIEFIFLLLLVPTIVIIYRLASFSIFVFMDSQPLLLFHFAVSISGTITGNVELARGELAKSKTRFIALDVCQSRSCIFS